MLVSWDSICCYVRVIFSDFGHLEFKSSMFFRTFFQQSKSGRPNFSIWKIWEDLYIPVWVSSRISGGLTMVNPPKEGWIYIKFHVNYSTRCASQIPSDTIEIRPALDSFGRGVGTWSLCRRDLDGEELAFTSQKKHQVIQIYHIYIYIYMSNRKNPGNTKYVFDGHWFMEIDGNC